MQIQKMFSDIDFDELDRNERNKSAGNIQLEQGGFLIQTEADL